MRYLVLICLVTQSFGQWTSFFQEKRSSQLYQLGGMTVAHQHTLRIPKDRRIILGTTMNKGLTNTGIIPIVHGDIKLSWNLSLRGKMGNYSAKEGAVQLFGWGMSIKPGKEKNMSKWTLLFDAGQLYSHSQIKIMSIQFMGRRTVKLKGATFQIGLGINMAEGTPLSLVENELLSKIKIQTNFLNMGTSFKLFGLHVSPQIWTNANYNQISISIMDTF